MASLVHIHRKELEQVGEYVVRANIGWFALFPKTLERRRATALEQGRIEPNLVLYRNRSEDPRDHYVIPMSRLATLLVTETLSDSHTGNKRWNLALKNDGKLHVTHSREVLDVSSLYGSHLLIEVEAEEGDLEPTDDVSLLESRVLSLRKRKNLARPSGEQSPVHRSQTYSTGFIRRPDVKAWVLQQSRGVCELCQSPAPFHDASGLPYLEHHHVTTLAEGGPDTIENSVAVCPNCHRHLHYGSDRLVRREMLYAKVERLRR